ncbi:dihydrofolate reductase family protein [Streptomyces sudanensis]|uniref:dihydrofolate reductase family protein n=1 Tax=Streptomyces sudanensis TaxID=436397 RepID=UPI0020CBCEE5|nr:dihydrofolate reductase family protein [Streptomyces sudanensis]MCP9959226.1 dihydrofolate reductase family protein [Streptomyces sudanensis]MCP9988305.1 dihydrofolate reductase family protein [Streptomyces sudanensis]MCQ0000317.1 dihydrofolate reductase family protein [Streptomyces sudanensis]
MNKVYASLGLSLDGFLAGPRAGPDNPFGDGGARLREWLVTPEDPARAGAYVMGRRTFDEGERIWPDPPPFGAPVFVLTTTARDAQVREGTVFTYVTDGVHAALDRARAVAGSRDVRISGGAHTVRQYLNEGLVDELVLHLVPVLVGSGVRLFDGVDPALRLAKAPAVDVAELTHLRYRIVH